MNKKWPSHYRVEAHISEDGKYRYWLDINWNADLPRLAFVMLNPSKADHSIDDPTALRVVSFAKRENFGGVIIGNLYAYRATEPKELLTVADPVGPSNLPTLLSLPDRASKIVVGWGSHGEGTNARDSFVGYMKAKELWCLGTTKSGEPRHPLYLKSDAALVRWPVPKTDGEIR